MAQIGNLEVFLTADLSDFEKNVKSGQKILRDLAQKFVESGKSVQDFNANVVAGMMRSEKALKNAQKPATELNAILKALGNTLAEQTEGVAKNSVAAKNLAISYIAEREAVKQAADAKKAYTKVAKEQTEAIKQTDTQMKEYINSLVDFDKLQRQAEVNVKSFSSSMWLITAGLTQFGRSMTQAFTVPIIGAGAAATKVFTDFEKATVAIQRAAELTTSEANSITDAFVKISQQVPLTVTDLQKAGYAAAQAGVTGEDAIVNFAKAAVMLSTVGGDALKSLPIEDLANQLAKLSIAFGETGDNWDRVNNIASTLLVVAKAVPGGLEEIIEGMRRVSGTAVALGIDLAGATAIVGTLVASGVPAARAGTELNRVLLDMTENSDKVAQALGYTTENMSEFRQRMEDDMIGVLQELVNRYGLVENKIDSINHLQEIFGEVGLKAMLPLINNAPIFNDLLARANKELESGALLSAEFDTQANSLSGTLTVFANAVKSVAYAIGQDLAPYINWLAKTATSALITFATAWKAIPAPVKAVAVAVLGLIALLGPLALLINTAFLSPIAGITTFITKLVQAVIALGALSQAETVTTIATNQLAVAFGYASVGLANLIKGLAVIATRFLVVTAVVIALSVAIGALAKLLGIGFKLPKMPEIRMPKYGGTAGFGGDLGTESMEAASEADEKAAKAREKALERELKAKRRARDKELKAIDENIKAYEKVRDAQIKAQQKMVEQTEDELDERKDLWEAEKEAEEAKIEVQNDILDSNKKLLKEQKKQLEALKEEQDAQVEVAKNAVEYAEMNLDEAQEWLKREQILGHDEYDASYRAALEAVKFWEARVTLAKENLIDVKQTSSAALEAQEALVDQTEEQVDAQEEIIDALKEALSDRKRIVDDEIKLIQDELEARRDALDAIKETTGEKLSILREEKSARQDALDEELDILQEKLDAERNALEDMRDMDLSALPDGIANIGANLEELDKKMREEIDKIGQGISDDMSFGPTVDPDSPIGQGTALYEAMRENGYGAFESYVAGFIYGIERLGAKVDTAISGFITEAGKQLKALGEIMDKALVDSVFGEGTWDELNSKAAANGKELSNAFSKALIEEAGVQSKEIGKSILESVWGEGTVDELKKQSEEEGRSIPDILYESFKINMESLWTSIKQTLMDAFYGYGTWNELKRQSDESGKSVSQLLWESFSLNVSTFYEKVKKKVEENILQPVRDAYGKFKEAGTDLIAGVRKGIEEKFNDVKTKVSSLWDDIKNVFKYAWQSAHGWGQDIMNGLRRGLSDAWDWVKNGIKNVWENVKNSVKDVFNIHSPSGVFADYGKDIMLGLEEGINNFSSRAIESLTDVAKKMTDVDISSEVDLGLVSGGIGSNIGNEASQLTSIRDNQAQLQQAVAQTTVNRNFYVQPGQMIATRGEVRNFIRMIKEYEKFEEDR